MTSSPTFELEGLSEGSKSIPDSLSPVNLSLKTWSEGNFPLSKVSLSTLGYFCHFYPLLWKRCHRVLASLDHQHIGHTSGGSEAIVVNGCWPTEHLAPRVLHSQGLFSGTKQNKVNPSINGVSSALDLLNLLWGIWHPLFCAVSSFWILISLGFCDIAFLLLFLPLVTPLISFSGSFYSFNIGIPQDSVLDPPLYSPTPVAQMETPQIYTSSPDCFWHLEGEVKNVTEVIRLGGGAIDKRRRAGFKENMIWFCRNELEIPMGHPGRDVLEAGKCGSRTQKTGQGYRKIGAPSSTEMIVNEKAKGENSGREDEQSLRKMPILRKHGKDKTIE